MPEGDQDDPGDDLRKQAAAQRAQPIPHNTSTATAPALRYRSQPDKSIRAIGLCAGESCKGCGFCGNHEKRKSGMGMLMQEMSRLARQAGGSNKTVHDRLALAQRFCERLVVVQNIQIRQVAQLKARHIEDYIRVRLAQGIARRSLQNEMAAIRSLLVQAGRNKLATSERISNRALGLAGGSRTGTHRAIPEAYYRQVLEVARTKDTGLAAALELSRLMGLRSQEAVQSVQSLKTWHQAIERGEPRLTVVFGTKGGRPRETLILDTVAVRKALDNAIIVAEGRNGRLIDKPDLKTAMKYWHSQASRMGLTGAYSPHSLRYAWAQEAIRHYLAQGFSQKEALAQTAMDLGHGDGRGQYIRLVYARGIVP